MRPISLGLLFLIAFTRVDAAIVEFTFSGALEVDSGDADVFDLDGANFFAKYRYDTTATPIFTILGLGLAQSDYPLLLAQVTFTNRPNAASETTVAYDAGHFNGTVSNFNVFPPETVNDQLIVEVNVLSGEFSELLVICCRFEFHDQDFLPGTSAPALPIFTAADVTVFGFFGFTSHSANYNARNSSFTVTTIPLPAALWLFVSTLGLLGVRRTRSELTTACETLVEGIA